VHERLSTAAIIKTLEDHRKRPDQAVALKRGAAPISGLAVASCRCS